MAENQFLFKFPQDVPKTNGRAGLEKEPVAMTPAKPTSLRLKTSRLSVQLLFERVAFAKRDSLGLRESACPVNNVMNAIRLSEE